MKCRFDRPTRRAFCQPIQLYLELPYLPVRLVYKLLSLHWSLLVTAPEDRGQLIERLPVPFADLVRVDAIHRRDSSHRPLAPERLKSNSGPEPPIEPPSHAFRPKSPGDPTAGFSITSAGFLL